MAHIPMKAGTIDLDITTWKPQPDTLWDTIKILLLGGAPQLRDDSVVHSTQSRANLRTVSSGTVTVKLSIAFRNWEKYGISFV